MSRSFDVYKHRLLEPGEIEHHHKNGAVKRNNPADIFIDYRREFIKKHGEDAWNDQQQAYREWEESFYEND